MQQVPIDLLGVGSVRLRKAHGGHTCPERGGEKGQAGGGFQGRHRPKEAAVRRPRMGAEREGGRCPDCPPTYLSWPAPQDWHPHLWRERQRCQRTSGRSRRGSLEKGADSHLPPPKHPLPKFPTQTTPLQERSKKDTTPPPSQVQLFKTDGNSFCVAARGGGLKTPSWRSTEIHRGQLPYPPHLDSFGPKGTALPGVSLTFSRGLRFACDGGVRICHRL